VHVEQAGEVGSFGSFTHTVKVYSTPTILLINAEGKTSSVTGLTDAFSIGQAIKKSSGRSKPGRSLKLGACQQPPKALQQHLERPLGRGHLPSHAHTGAAGGAACGDLVRISLALDPLSASGEIRDAGFDASGCGAVLAAGAAPPSA